MKRLSDYAGDLLAEAEQLGGVPNLLAISAADADPPESRGFVQGTVYLTESAFVAVNELVQMRGGGATRVRFAYFLVIDGDEVGGYERSPTHNPSEHRHCGPDHKRQPAPAISFKDALHEAWDMVNGKHKDCPDKPGLISRFVERGS